MMNGPAINVPLNISAYLPVSAKYVRLSVVTIDGDGDDSCINAWPLETSISGLGEDGIFQTTYVYNVGKTSTAFYLGSGWDIQIPVSNKVIYINKPLGCTNNFNYGGMQIFIYLMAYM